MQQKAAPCSVKGSLKSSKSGHPGADLRVCGAGSCQRFSPISPQTRGSGMRYGRLYLCGPDEDSKPVLGLGLYDLHGRLASRQSVYASGTASAWMLDASTRRQQQCVIPLRAHGWSAVMLRGHRRTRHSAQCQLLSVRPTAHRESLPASAAPMYWRRKGRSPHKCGSQARHLDGRERHCTLRSGPVFSLHNKYEAYLNTLCRTISHSPA